MSDPGGRARGRQLRVRGRRRGIVAPPTAQDLITLKQAGVSDAVVHAMQAPPALAQAPLPVAGPPPLVVEEHYYGPLRRPFRHGCRAGYPVHPGVSFGVAFSN